MLIVTKIALRDFLEGSPGKKCHSACWGNSHAFVVGSEAGQCNNLSSKAWVPFSGSHPACRIQELSCPAWNHGRHHPTVHAGHENLNATCYMPRMLKSVFIRCAVPSVGLPCVVSKRQVLCLLQLYFSLLICATDNFVRGAIAGYPGPAITCVGVLWRTRHITIVATLIQWDANKWRGILQFSEMIKFSEIL